MGKVINYVHHGKVVHVDEELKGLHRKHCLCYRCKEFYANPKCPIAHAVYLNCVEYGIVTPVFECPNFDETTIKVFKDENIG